MVKVCATHNAIPSSSEELFALVCCCALGLGPFLRPFERLLTLGEFLTLDLVSLLVCFCPRFDELLSSKAFSSGRLFSSVSDSDDELLKCSIFCRYFSRLRLLTKGIIDNRLFCWADNRKIKIQVSRNR